MTILYTSFHILDLDNDTVQRKEMPEEFQGFVKEYIEYANSNEKNKMYIIHDEQTQVVSCIRQMALNQEKCEVLTDSIADKLLMSEKLAQAKIYRMGSNVKKGSLIQALVQNSSDELLFVVAKVEHSKWYDGSDLSKKYGFSGDKKSLWKSAVFSMYEINSHIVFKDVKAFKAVDNELKSAVEPVSKKDYVKLSSELQNVMNTPQQLNYNQCIDNLIDSYSFSEEEIEKDVIKDCLLALPERKNFDTEFKVVPESLNNKRTKKFQLSQGIELTIRSDAMEYPDKIVSTVVDGKRVIQIVCEDDDTYDAFA